MRTCAEPGHCVPCSPHRPQAHAYIKDKAFGLRIRPPDRNGDANRLVDHGKARYQRSRSEFYTPVFPFPVQDACGRRDSRRRTRKATASGAARLEQSHGRAAHCGSCPPSARRHHSARDLRTRSAQRLSSEDRMAAGTSVPYFASRSWIRNLGAVANGNASRNCWMIQLLVGCFVMLKCRIRRRSWLMTKKQ